MTPRTIADALAAGSTHLRVECPRCQRVVLMPWELLRMRRTAPIADAIRRMRCSACTALPVRGLLWRSEMESYEGRELPRVWVEVGDDDDGSCPPG